jgi:hypothetical protein
MARFVPPLDPATLTNNGERVVATALAGLPNWVTVYHGYLLLERFRSRTGREFYREGGIDFIVFDRRRGILVLEVKGGERIESLLDLWSRRDRIDSLDDAGVRGIRGALQSALSLIPVMAVRVVARSGQ